MDLDSLPIELRMKIFEFMPIRYQLLVLKNNDDYRYNFNVKIRKLAFVCADLKNSNDNPTICSLYANGFKIHLIPRREIDYRVNLFENFVFYYPYVEHFVLIVDKAISLGICNLIDRFRKWPRLRKFEFYAGHPARHYGWLQALLRFRNPGLNELYVNDYFSTPSGKHLCPVPVYDYQTVICKKVELEFDRIEFKYDEVAEQLLAHNISDRWFQ